MRQIAARAHHAHIEEYTWDDDVVDDDDDVYRSLCILCTHSAQTRYRIHSHRLYKDTRTHTDPNTHTSTAIHQRDARRMNLDARKSIWKIAKPNSYFTYLTLTFEKKRYTFIHGSVC